MFNNKKTFINIENLINTISSIFVYNENNIDYDAIENKLKK